MRGSEEHIDELIERYVLGQMSEEERSDFENELRANSRLQDLVSESQTLKEVIRSEENIAVFQDTLKTVVQEKRKSPSYLRWWGAAAAMVFCVSAIIWMHQANQTSNPSELVLAYFEPFPDVLTSRDQGDSLVSLAMTAYGVGDYIQAISILKSIENDDSSLFRFYIGVSYQATGDYEKALDIWEELEESPERSLKFDIKWYKALALLGLNESERAKPIVQELVNQPSSVQSKARMLLEEL